MKNSKLKLISIAVLLIVVSCLALFTSCGGPEVSDIAVKSTNAPRLTYVLGQELDLTKGAAADRLQIVRNARGTAACVRIGDFDADEIRTRIRREERACIGHTGRTRPPLIMVRTPATAGMERHRIIICIQ